MKTPLNQMNLFIEGNSRTQDTKKPATMEHKPLAYQARPTTFSDFVGQDHIWIEYPFLKHRPLPSMIIWGPPGVGKTTLAYLLAKDSKQEIFTFNAVLAGVAELRKLISRIQDMQNFHQQKSIIFIDEIHRFNKAQQDALLPHVERGDFTLIGATTEYPQQSINRALLSRTQIIKLHQLDETALNNILARCSKKLEIQLPAETLRFIAKFSGGDVRKAINALEMLHPKLKTIKNKDEQRNLLHRYFAKSGRYYDKNGQRHYDVISAFIKSMRAGKANDAIGWLAVMLDGGEDPRFIARRLSIFAAEDIGNANPTATLLASATLIAVDKIGMPEIRINLAQTTEYLTKCQKSNTSYQAINNALDFVQRTPDIAVPADLSNHPQHSNVGTATSFPKFY